MEPVGMSRGEAVALVRRIMEARGASEGEEHGWLDRLDRALGCPTGYVGGLIFWGGDLSPDEVVERALSYRPIAL